MQARCRLRRRKWQYLRRGLTLRSSGEPPASHQARAVPCFILHHAGLASCRCLPLSSNVRPHDAAVPPTTLFLDLDGVLRLWPRDYSALEAEYSLPGGSLTAVAFESGLLQQVITGRLSDVQWRTEVASRLSAAFPRSRAHEAVTAWSAPAGSVHQGVLRLATQARKVCRLGLITNATDRLPRDLATLGLAEDLDFVINSSDVGHAKPNPEIFHYALALASAQPAEVVFVDDKPSNVAAASALGIRAHHFTSVGSMREFLQSLGLPSNAA